MKLPESSRYVRFCRDILQLICSTAAEHGIILHYPHVLEVHDTLPRGVTSNTGGDARVYRHRGRIRVFLPNIFKSVVRDWCLPQERARKPSKKTIQAAKQFAERADREGFYAETMLPPVLLHELVHLAQGPLELGHNCEFIHLSKQLAPLFEIWPCFHVEDTLNWPLDTEKYGRMLLGAPKRWERAKKAALAFSKESP